MCHIVPSLSERVFYYGCSATELLYTSSYHGPFLGDTLWDGRVDILPLSMFLAFVYDKDSEHQRVSKI